MGLDTLIADLEARTAVRAARLDRYLAIEGERPFQSGSRDGWTLLVSRDPSRPGQWRVTRFEGAEPVGHAEAATFRDAVAVVHDMGGEVPIVPDTVIRLHRVRAADVRPTLFVVERRSVR